ncbi:hypothetical protein ACFUJR_28310 [Streptomyces sp. NPDC057271]|uniref:hypothetical protein n=1 Tax=unclassified Streptomyces TaxID=2593676 RepID=UPI003629803B
MGDVDDLEEATKTLNKTGDTRLHATAGCNDALGGLPPLGSLYDGDGDPQAEGRRLGVYVIDRAESNDGEDPAAVWTFVCKLMVLKSLDLVDADDDRASVEGKWKDGIGEERHRAFMSGCLK